jgi:hypothetical protein
MVAQIGLSRRLVAGLSCREVRVQQTSVAGEGAAAPRRRREDVGTERVCEGHQCVISLPSDRGTDPVDGDDLGCRFDPEPGKDLPGGELHRVLDLHLGQAQVFRRLEQPFRAPLGGLPVRIALPGTTGARSAGGGDPGLPALRRTANLSGPREPSDALPNFPDD